MALFHDVPERIYCPGSGVSSFAAQLAEARHGQIVEDMTISLRKKQD
jgi:hypothetical protein